MKANLKIANDLLDLFGESAFYNISVWDDKVVLQGKFQPPISQRCNADEYTVEVDNSGYFHMKKGNVVIILT
jgi:hypothetical protein